LKDVAGKLASEVMPGTEPYWIETFGRVVETGEAEQIERWHQPTGRWVHSSTARVGGPGSRRLASVFYDITDRKRAEIALRENERRQTFLLSLTDALRPITDPAVVQTTAMRLLAEHLDVMRASYFELEEDGDTFHLAARFERQATEMPERMRLSDFSPALANAYRSGRTLAVADTSVLGEFVENPEPYTNIGVGAWAAVPLMRGGRLMAWIGVHSQTRRDWSTDDLQTLNDVAERTWGASEHADAEAALRESEARFRQFADNSAAGLWIRNASTLDMEYVSPVVSGIYGVEAGRLLGGIERWAAMIVPEDRNMALLHIERARQGDAVVHEFRIQRPHDKAFRWIRNTAFPLFDDKGRVERIGGIAEDVTEAKLASEHQGVLLAELQHRVRNIMAIIRSIAARTGERAMSVQQYSELLAGRLVALARVQALLTRAANTSVGIRAIVDDELSAQAHHEGQFVLEGTDVRLAPKAAEILTLVCHELATNALKYGALSVPHGTVTVRWSTFDKRGGPWLALDWIEEGAHERAPPTTDEPRRRGFGTELIEARVPYELKGRGSVSIEPGGARCHLEFPLVDGASILETSAPQRAIVFGGALDMTGEADLTGYRVLVVEDDFYLATDTARALQGAGATVLGPSANEDDARAELAEQRPDAVVLDINLGQGPTFKLAEALKDQGIPFIFVTGYDHDVIPAEFDDIERLEKPAHLRRIVSAIAKLVDGSAAKDGAPRV
jgi:PAS domain S-box-containing protein